MKNNTWRPLFLSHVCRMFVAWSCRVAVGGDSAGGNLSAVLAQDALAAVTDRKHSIFNLSIVAVSALTVKWMERRISAANRFAPAFFQERVVFRILMQEGKLSDTCIVGELLVEGRELS